MCDSLPLHVNIERTLYGSHMPPTLSFSRHQIRRMLFMTFTFRRGGFPVACIASSVQRLGQGSSGLLQSDTFAFATGHRCLNHSHLILKLGLAMHQAGMIIHEKLESLLAIGSCCKSPAGAILSEALRPSRLRSHTVAQSWAVRNGLRARPHWPQGRIHWWRA